MVPVLGGSVITIVHRADLEFVLNAVHQVSDRNFTVDHLVLARWDVIPIVVGDVDCLGRVIWIFVSVPVLILIDRGIFGVFPSQLHLGVAAGGGEDRFVWFRSYGRAISSCGIARTDHVHRSNGERVHCSVGQTSRCEVHRARIASRNILEARAAVFAVLVFGDRGNGGAGGSDVPIQCHLSVAGVCGEVCRRIWHAQRGGADGVRCGAGSAFV